MLTDSGVWVEKAKEAIEDQVTITRWSMNEYFRRINETMGYSQASMDLQNAIAKQVVDMGENICTWRDKLYYNDLSSSNGEAGGQL